ncbi:MAG: hypothetical protein OYG31_01740 [Candidatus Kaiserbacteria bacterium]|nr:hypothetical protein [Candidatus Kaiserbacteria bacterium]
MKKRKPIFILDTNITYQGGNLFKHFDEYDVQYEIYLPGYVLKEMSERKIKYSFQKECKVLETNIISRKTFEEMTASYFENSSTKKLDFKDMLIWLQIKKSPVLKRRRNVDIYFITNDSDFLKMKGGLESDFKKEHKQEITILSRQDVNFELMNLYRDKINVNRSDMEKIKSLIKKNKEKVLLRSIETIENMKNLTPPNMSKSYENIDNFPFFTSSDNRRYEYLFFKEYHLSTSQNSVYPISEEEEGIFKVSLTLSAECIGLTQNNTSILSRYDPFKKPDIESNVSSDNIFPANPSHFSPLATQNSTIANLVPLGKKIFYCTVIINIKESVVEFDEVDHSPHY